MYGMCGGAVIALSSWLKDPGFESGCSELVCYDFSLRLVVVKVIIASFIIRHFIFMLDSELCV